MKKICPFLFLLWALALAAGAQNDHWSYSVSPSLYTPMRAKSAVTVVYSNNVAYVIQSEDNILYVSEVDPATMLVLGTTYTLTPGTMYQNIVLRGGYEDLNGDIVVYGNCYTTVGYDVHFAAILNPGNNFVGSRYLFDHSINPLGVFVAGCCGYDVNGTVVQILVSSNGKLYAYDNNYTFYTSGYASTYGSETHFTDISWDNHHQCFIASGSALDYTVHTCDPFLFFFTFNLSTLSWPPMLCYVIRNNLYTDWSEGRALHANLNVDADELVLYQDLRENDYDIIWLTHIGDYLNNNPTIYSSYCHLLPLHKISAYDLVYDSHNNRLDLLGQFDYCDAPATFIAQTDPYNLSYLNIGQVSSPTGNSFCPSWNVPNQNILGNSVKLNNTALNPFNPCHTILHTGVCKNSQDTTAYVTETADISLSKCDYPAFPLSKDRFPTIQTFASPVSLDTCLFGNLFFSTTSGAYTSEVNECKDAVACHKENWEYPMPRMLGKGESAIHMEDGHHFVCENFSGTIRYAIYDVSGALMDNGLTINGEKNILTVYRSGLYFIVADDDNGNCAVLKFPVVR